MTLFVISVKHMIANLLHLGNMAYQRKKATKLNYEPTVRFINIQFNETNSS